MNAYAVKPKTPYATRKELQRIPANDEYRKMIEFMDSHEFSFSIDKESNELRCTYTKKLI